MDLMYIIQRVTAARFGVAKMPQALTSQRRTRSVTVPRQVAMYLAIECTDLPVQHIAEAFKRDRTTVLYAHRRVKERRKSDPDFDMQVENTIKAVQSTVDLLTKEPVHA